MVKKNFVEKNKYYDSVLLMKLAGKIGKTDGIIQISVGMGTPLNKDTMNDLGLLLEDGRAASANDLIIAIEAASEEIAAEAKEAYLAAITQQRGSSKSEYRSLETMSRYVKDRNIAVISLAGSFAGAEARKALRMGMDVFMFSDNVPLEQELELKQYAKAHGLLMMGPDCGLSFINGVAIGLCSRVRRGHIGIVAASGSGMQETMNIIHRDGHGVSHAIGVGGRDLQDYIGGITMLQSIDILENDPETKVIVIISKPPQEKTTVKVLERVRACTKPVVLQLINADLTGLDTGNAEVSKSFEESAMMAIALSESKAYVSIPEEVRWAKVDGLARAEALKLRSSQRYMRGLYCGGSLAEEAIALSEPILGSLYGNIAFEEDHVLADPFHSVKDCLIDVGSEEFTLGKPHVAIDPAPRCERFLQEAEDPETAVILMDFLLGYALCEDPAGMMAETIRNGVGKAASEGRHLTVVASICGSDLDPQGLAAQRKILEDAGVIVMDNNGEAARLAAMIIKHRRELLA